jgi:hypothetical protein
MIFFNKAMVFSVFLCTGVFFIADTSHASYREDFPEFSGIIVDHDETWNKSEEHVIDRDLVVVDGAKLTIEPGTTITFKNELEGAPVVLSVFNGSLQAIGTVTEPIIFERSDDSIGGFSLEFDAWDSEQSVVEYVRIRNGGEVFDGGSSQASSFFAKRAMAYFGENGYAALLFWSGKVDMRRTIFENSEFADVYSYSSKFDEWFDENGHIYTEPSLFLVENSDFSGPTVVPAIRIDDSSCSNSAPSCPRKVSFKNNWYASPSGPLHGSNPTGTGKSIEGTIELEGWSDHTNVCLENCHSSVMFLPGIMGSRLYGKDDSGDEHELWVSSLDGQQGLLAMNPDGTSRNDVDIYTKADIKRENDADNAQEAGLVDSAYGVELYQSFINNLRDWRAQGVFADYAFIPYDWRISPKDVVMDGKVTDGKLSYTNHNTDLTKSYLYQQAKALQADSNSGKLTLVGHSNGGLVIKAFIQKLKEENDPLYVQIDKVVFVDVPQLGTPDTTVSLLYGSKIGIAWLGVSAQMTRLLGHFMPDMYDLLPSEKLFSAINPPIEFKGNNINPAWISRYGSTIDTYGEFKDFLTDNATRNRPDVADTELPEVLDSTLLGKAESNHAVWDNWSPSPETEVVQIAGWGLYTVSGLEVTDAKICQFDANQLNSGRPVCDDNRISTITVRDRLTLNGDGTVIVPSALAMDKSEKVKKYWVDLYRYNDDEEYFFTEKQHKNILEVGTLRPFIKSLVENTGVDFRYISDSEPSKPSDLKYVKYEIHSPLHLTVTDATGNKAGWDSTTDSIVENIKGAQYFEIGEVKMLLVPKEIEHTVKLVAYKQGSFTLNIDELDGETVVNETKFEAIPALEDSVVDIAPTLGTEPIRMSIDFDGNGTAETNVEAIPGGSAEYENPTEQDAVAPEIAATFDQSTKDVVWKATDNQDESPVVTVTSTEVTATDKAGNTIAIPFIKYRENATRLKVQFEKVVYNGEEMSIPKTTLVYDWKLKKDVLTDLDTELRLKEKSRLRAEYRKQKNETRIIERDKEEKTKTVTMKPGFVSVSVRTEKGEIVWGY